MTNPYYNHTSGVPAADTKGLSSALRSEFDGIAGGFDSVDAALDAVFAGGGLASTSVTSLTIGTGSKSLTVAASLSFAAGQYVVIASTAAPTVDYMEGRITSYNSTTGALVVDVAITAGSGTLASWTVALQAGLPNQAGNSGKFLTTDGTNASWASVAGLVPIDAMVAYKDAGNSFTNNGATFLKTGVVATAATYPNATAWTLNDAATWVARTGNATPALNYVSRTATGNSITVICSGLNGTTYLTTTDGVTFTARSFPASIIPRIAFGNGVFVVTDATGAATTAYTSTDGINWTSRTVSSASNRQIMFGGGKFVSPHSTGVDITTDGITWSAVSGAPSNISGAGAYGNGRFCTINYTSPDGQSWNNWSTPSGMGSLRKIVFGNGVFAAFTNEADGTIWTSSDGLSWTPYTPPVSYGLVSGFTDCAFGNGTFLFTQGSSSSTAYKTTDFITWNTVTLPSSTIWDMAVFSSVANAFCVFDSGTTTAASSVTSGSYVGSPNAVYAGGDYNKPFYMRVA